MEAQQLKFLVQNSDCCAIQRASKMHTSQIGASERRALTVRDAPAVTFETVT
jgi:hypothetical protein